MRPLISFLTFSLVLAIGRLQASLALPSASTPQSAGIPKLKDSVSPPRDWVDLGRAPPTQYIPLRIALPQARFSELESQLYQMSNPHHPRYGQHLMKEQVEELVRPNQRSVEAVDAWLADYGIVGDRMIRRSPGGDWVTIIVPVAVAEEMLDTEFHLWKQSRDGDNEGVVIRTTHYSLPEHLHAHIELVQPTTYFGRPKPMSATLFFEGINITISLSPSPPPQDPGSPIPPPENCTRTMTVACLKYIYNIGGYQASATNKNAIGITGYLNQYANIADLQSFYAAERPDAVNSTFKFVSVHNGLNDQSLDKVGPEANLDTQFGFGLSFPTPGTFYSTAGSPPFNPDLKTPSNTNEPYDDWLQFMLALRAQDVPQTISTSYADDEQTVPKDYAVRVCKEFALLGSRGVSVIFSSGDAGVGDSNPDPSTHKCYSNDGKNQAKFLPQFPGGCPYVTAVGGTYGIPEIAAPFSGGGFSNYFARPDYQQTAVQNYLDNLPDGQYEGLFNPLGRAYPDVSAQSRRYLIWYQGFPALISGTSASAPTFAAIVALLNDASLAAGKAPLGFLNPMLYSIGAAGMNDVTVGNAPGCGTQGFNVRFPVVFCFSRVPWLTLLFYFFLEPLLWGNGQATTGWDPVTGLGRPILAS
ncbi:tripeptidyl peptidase A [Russula brevipes]|nr:tripeptidyl peptidase A [Russula brevipes]